MAITLNGTTGITTPADTITGNATVGGTLAVTGATTVGGVAVVAVAPGTNGNVLTSNGTTWASTAPAASGSQIKSQLFTATGSWTAPTGVTQVRATVIAGGGSGGYGDSTCALQGRDGGPGGFALGIYTVVPGTSYAITCGTGGATVGSGGGSPGTSSSFASFCSATGGAGGAATTSGTYSAAQGVGTGGTLRNSAAPTNPLLPWFFSNLSPFTGWVRNGGGGSNTAAVAFSVSGLSGAGFGGGGAISGQSGGAGGTGGIVYLEWVG